MYFSEAKVGDKVWDYVYGEGEITCRDDDKWLIGVTYPITESIPFNFRTFNLDGKIYSYENQRLFYYDSRPIVITQDDLKISKDAIRYTLFDRTIGQTWICTEFDKDREINCIAEFKDKSIDKYTRKVIPRENTAERLMKVAEEEYKRREKLSLEESADLYAGTSTNKTCFYCSHYKDFRCIKFDVTLIAPYQACKDFKEETPEFVKDIVKEAEELNRLICKCCDIIEVPINTCERNIEQRVSDIERRLDEI